MKNISLLLILALLSGCAATQPVRVVPEGETKAVLSLGGPVIKLGVPLPVPYTNLGILYGYTGDVTLSANAHVLAAALGDLGLDAGAAVRLLRQNGWAPELTAKAQIYLFDNLARGANSPRVLPMISVNASYLRGESWLLYIGADNLYQPSPALFLLSPFIGTEFSISNPLRGQVELKWVAANANTEHGVFEGYAAIAGHGNMGLYLGLTYSF